jgi:hypothetical protein
MLGTLAISVTVAAVLVTAWYLAFSRYNKRRALVVLRWLENALGGQGHIVGVEWLAPSRCHVPLRLRSALFQRASVTVDLAPRELPFHWLVRHWRKQRDTVLFSADLDVPPAMNLDLQSHRWCGRTRKRLSTDPKRWHVDQALPLVLTSRQDWDLGGVMNSLLSTPHRDFLELAIRRKSPHLRARVPLESLAPESPNCRQLFQVLREVAAGASATQS